MKRDEGDLRDTLFPFYVSRNFKRSKEETLRRQKAISALSILQGVCTNEISLYAISTRNPTPIIEMNG
jgi:hypothetical protein